MVVLSWSVTGHQKVDIKLSKVDITPISQCPSDVSFLEVSRGRKRKEPGLVCDGLSSALKEIQQIVQQTKEAAYWAVFYKRRRLSRNLMLRN